MYGGPDLKSDYFTSELLRLVNADFSKAGTFQRLTRNIFVIRNGLAFSA
jgi:hypothetical protein